MLPLGLCRNEFLASIDEFLWQEGIGLGSNLCPGQALVHCVSWTFFLRIEKSTLIEPRVVISFLTANVVVFWI